MNSTENKLKIKDLTRSELQSYIIGLGEKKYRADQIFNWLYNNLSEDFDSMQNIPKELRQLLNEKSIISTLRKINQDNSTGTLTRKFLFETIDGKKIESVLIPDNDRNTLCISTQVGCPLDCKFCATGLMGYTRNLSAGEILDQYLSTAKEYGKEKITNIVYMGMGEPLINYEATEKSLRLLTDEMNEGITRNRITVSTAGIPKRIIDLANTDMRVKLAFSLHSCFEDIRSKIMPINKKYSLAENLKALQYYANKTKTKITFEYTMLKGLNDREEDIRALAKLTSQLHSKINIIPFNSIKHMDPDGISGELEPTPLDKIYRFAEKLRERKVTVLIRDTQGDDIAAACGQLAIKN